MSGVSAIHLPTLSTSHPLLTSWPGLLACHIYHRNLLPGAGKKQIYYIYHVCPDPLRGGLKLELKQRKEKYVLNNVPDFEVSHVNSGLEGERIVHLSPIQFSPSQHFQHKTETQCSVIVRLLTLHASLTSDMGQLER